MHVWIFNFSPWCNMNSCQLTISRFALKMFDYLSQGNLLSVKCAENLWSGVWINPTFFEVLLTKDETLNSVKIHSASTRLLRKIPYAHWWLWTWGITWKVSFQNWSFVLQYLLNRYYERISLTKKNVFACCSVTVDHRQYGLKVN